MHVRRAIPADASAIRALADDATAQIYDQVQASGAWLPALSLVALGPDGQIPAAAWDRRPPWRSPRQPCTPVCAATGSAPPSCTPYSAQPTHSASR